MIRIRAFLRLGKNPLILLRRQTDKVFKVIGEMTLIRKAGHSRRFNRRNSLFQQLLGPIDPIVCK